MKHFLYKLRTDLRAFMRYPAIAAGKDLSVDYDVYWHRRGGIKGRGLSAWQKDRANIAISMMEPGSTVLDLGAGDGAMLVYMREKIGIRPMGVEVSRDSLEALRQNGIEAFDVDIMDRAAVTALPEVDYITGFEILEHMPNPESLLDALRPKARLLCGRFPLQWIAHPGEHLRFWTLADVRSWVPQIGFKLLRLAPYQGLPGLSRLAPSWFAQGIVIVLH
jgi:hypothetical protein